MQHLTQLLLTEAAQAMLPQYSLVTPGLDTSSQACCTFAGPHMHMYSLVKYNAVLYMFALYINITHCQLVDLFEAAIFSAWIVRTQEDPTLEQASTSIQLLCLMTA